MNKKYVLGMVGILAILLATAIVTIAQVGQNGGLQGGYGGALGVSVEPALPNHVWRNCYINGTVNVNYTVLNYDVQEKWFRYKGLVTFNYDDNTTCQAGINPHTVDFVKAQNETNFEAGERALKQDLRYVWNYWYNKNKTREPELNITGSYSQ